MTSIGAWIDVPLPIMEAYHADSLKRKGDARVKGLLRAKKAPAGTHLEGGHRSATRNTEGGKGHGGSSVSVEAHGSGPSQALQPVRLGLLTELSKVALGSKHLCPFGAQ